MSATRGAGQQPDPSQDDDDLTHEELLLTVMVLQEQVDEYRALLIALGVHPLLLPDPE